jgi:hypothetical protein
MGTDQYDKYCAAFLKCEKLRRDLRDLHRQKETLRKEAKDAKNQEIQVITSKEQESEIELRKAETVLRTEEIALKDQMLSVKEASCEVPHSFGGTDFMISLTRISAETGYLSIRKGS